MGDAQQQASNRQLTHHCVGNSRCPVRDRGCCAHGVVHQQLQASGFSIGRAAFQVVKLDVTVCRVEQLIERASVEGVVCSRLITEFDEC